MTAEQQTAIAGEGLPFPTDPDDFAAWYARQNLPLDLRMMAGLVRRDLGNFPLLSVTYTPQTLALVQANIAAFAAAVRAYTASGPLPTE